MSSTRATAKIPVPCHYAGALECTLQEIFSTMLNANVRVVPHTRVAAQPRLSAIVGFAGRISGFLCLHFDPESACSVASELVGMRLHRIDDIVYDAVGEVVNMVAGGLKNKLSRIEDAFKISIPSVVEGRDYETHAPAGSLDLLLGVSAGKYRFKVQLVVQNS